MSRSSFYRKGRADLIDALAQVAVSRAAEAADAKAAAKARHAAAKAAEDERPRLTAEDIQDARYVRDKHSWHEVVRVSAKSVTVRTAWSWDERLPIGDVLEVRS